MKRRSFVLFLIGLCCSGCFRVDLYAPYGTNVTLISSEKPTKVERRWRTWFVAWGISPLDNTTADLQISREKLTEVRVITEDNIPDALHGFLYVVLIPIGLTNQTIVVQGNRSLNDSAKVSRAH
jgi:hypothetical protein